MKGCSSIIVLFVLLFFGSQHAFAAVQPAGVLPYSDQCIQQQIYHTPFGLQGEGLSTIATGLSVGTSVPTQFNGGAEHRSYSKHHSRTAFIRYMLRRYQTYFLFFRGTERCDSTPYPCSPPCNYYIFHLHRIKVKC